MEIITIYLYQFFITFLLYILFITTITIFGLFIVYLLEKYFSIYYFKTLSLKYIFAFGIGLILFCSLIYICASFKMINFFTIYFPFIFLDFIFLILKRKSLNFHFYNLLKSFLKKKNNQIFIIILFFILFLQILFQLSIICAKLSLIDTDPFVNLNRTANIFKYNYIISFGPSYPPSFTLLNFTILSILINPDFKTIYFFFKFSPIFIFSLYILIMAGLVRYIFKKNYITLIALLLVLSSHYLIYRMDYFVSSNLATIIFLISTLIFLLDLPIQFFGVFFVGLYLLNPIIAFYFLIIFIIYIFINRTKRNKKSYFLKDFLKILIIIIILLIPYFIFIKIYNFEIYDIFNWYFKNYFKIDFDFNTNTLLLINDSRFIKNFTDILLNWIPNIPTWQKNLFQRNNIIFSPFFIFATFTYFIKSKNTHFQKIKIFYKIILTITIVFFFSPFYYILYSLTEFPFFFIMRVLEFFCGPLIIMECIGISHIEMKLRSYLQFKIKKKKKNASIFNKILNSNRKIMFLFVFLSLGNFIIFIYNNENNFDKNYYFEDDQINTIFFIFDVVPENTIIFVPNFTENQVFNWIYSLLYNYQYFIYEDSLNITLDDFKINLLNYSADFLLIDLNHINSNLLNDIISDTNFFIKIFENKENLIFKINKLVYL